MFKKKSIIKFESALDEYPNIIVPSKTLIPEWYKKIPRWENNEMVTIANNGISINGTIKQCMPFVDSLSIGYMLTLPFDIYVKQIDNTPFLVWKSDIEQSISWRPNVADENLVPIGCYPREYTWNPCVSYVVPKEYNLLVTHPLNRNDLPFVTISGVIDGGYVSHPHGNMPFYIKNNFQGLIKQGTPIAQIIPFRKESWISEKTSGLVKDGTLNKKRSTSVFSDWYKKTHWTRKDFS